MIECFITLALICVGPGHPSLGPALQGSAYVIDGDTIEIQDLVPTRVRLWGIQAPEAHAPGGEQATAALRSLVRAREVFCHDTGGRTWGRVVAICFLPDGRDVARIMVETGRAADWPRFSGGYYKPRQGAGR